jgi:hypothetical protein
MAARSKQPLWAVVRDELGRTIGEKTVIWRVKPESAGTIVFDGEGPTFVAGQMPTTAMITACVGDIESDPLEVTIWPAEGLRVGFRPRGGAFPLVPPPGPIHIRRD